MHRRRLVYSIVLLALAFLLAISGAVFLPTSSDLVVPIDRSALDAIAEKQSAANPSLPSKTGQEVRSSALKPAPDSRLVEHAPEGLLPRKAENGDRPADIYARPFELARLSADKPKLSLVITQAGISETMTAEAYLALPADVSFVMSPYAHDAERQMRDIRNRGHEIFLGVSSVVDSTAREDRGPYALDPAQNRDTNRNRLLAAMARFTGYAGLVGDVTDTAYRSADLRDLIASETKSRGVLLMSLIRKDSQTFELQPEHDRKDPQVCKSYLPAQKPSDLAIALDGILPRLKEARHCAVFLDPSPLALDALKDWIVKHQSHEFDLMPLSALMRLEGQG